MTADGERYPDILKEAAGADSALRKQRISMGSRLPAGKSVATCFAISTQGELMEGVIKAVATPTASSAARSALTRRPSK
jgi:hypothetical protein